MRDGLPLGAALNVFRPPYAVKLRPAQVASCNHSEGAIFRAQAQEFSSVGRASVSKALRFSSKINAKPEIRYQDNAGTQGEHDNADFCDFTPEKANPDALAGAVGADLSKRANGKIGRFRTAEYKIRAERATRLCVAIHDTHPDDARQILTAALFDLSAGMPPHTAYGDIREDARWWSDMATPAELMEYMGAALRSLGQKALCLDMRKRLFVTLFESFTEQDRTAFLMKVDPHGQFTRGKNS